MHMDQGKKIIEFSLLVGTHYCVFT